MLELVLPDSGRIQEEDARQANKHGYTKHEPALPLFTESDALRALTQLQPVATSGQSKWRQASRSNFIRRDTCSVRRSSSCDSRVARTILFGGDLGRYDRPVLPDPIDAVAADVVLVESTYGDRDHSARR